VSVLPHPQMVEPHSPEWYCHTLHISAATPYIFIILNGTTTLSILVRPHHVFSLF
jgi:hypothetical protein